MNDDNAEEILSDLNRAEEYLNYVCFHPAFNELNIHTQSILKNMRIDLQYVYEELSDDINVELKTE